MTMLDGTGRNTSAMSSATPATAASQPAERRNGAGSVSSGMPRPSAIANIARKSAQRASVRMM